MITLKVHITGETRKYSNDKGETTAEFFYCFLPNNPYPVKLVTYNPSRLKEGLYQVSFTLNEYKGRLSLNPDFTTAKLA